MDVGYLCDGKAVEGFGKVVKINGLPVYAVIVLAFYHPIQKTRKRESSGEDSQFGYKLSPRREKGLIRFFATMRYTAYNAIKKSPQITERQYDHKKQLSNKKNDEQAK